MYAQINYPEIQGINGHYTIAQVGCFITAFCNLAERLGVGGTNPSQLNSFLITNNIYTDIDDGVRDDVGWTTITQWRPDITVSSIGNGKPSSNNSIVKFAYNSYQTGKPTTHFCLVNDVNTGTIVDSWDGQIKSWNVYGGPVAYATYQRVTNTPQGGNDVTLTQQDVSELYNRILGRAPDPGGLANYTDKTLDFALQDMIGSQEFKNNMKAKYTNTVTVEVPTGTAATAEQVVGGKLVEVLKEALNG